MSPATFLGIPRRNTADPDGSPIRGEQPFPKAARKELANAQLRRNLAHATSTIRAKRALVVDEMPDWEALRDAGSAIKTDVMARLPELLEQLEANITARGGVVHWATDAQEANQIVTDLAQRAGLPMPRVYVSPQPAPNARVVQGSIEQSNVRSVVEMARMVEVTRTYTQVAGLLQQQSDMRRSAIDKLAEIPA